ncbi:MAG TPA: peptidylprolyl isomerase [Pyrinomonadaceae bacterium]|nr:peptidylprolyl isomerase [Pyrinomonadaceae bacterium]
MPEQAKNGDTVRVHYTGRLETGETFDSSAGGDPFEFTVGAEETIAGFEEGVRGMEVGERKTVEIEAENAYGQHIPARVQAIDRSIITESLGQEPEVGMALAMQIEPGQQIPVTIVEVTDTHVTLDANHPLAGEKLIFDIELVEIK